MSLKNKVGNYLILFGLIALIVFIGSVLAPPESFDTGAFLIGAACIGVGVNFGLSKGRPRAGGPPAGAGGPPAAPRPAAPAGGPPKPQRQGLLSKIMSGPNDKKKTAPGGGLGPGGGGGKSGGGGGGGKGGAPGKGGPGGKPGGGGGGKGGGGGGGKGGGKR